MRLYRDVLGGGADFDSAPGSTVTASVSIYRGANGTLVPVQYLGAPTRSTVNPNPGNACVKVPPTVEIEEGLYTFREINLPISTESYFIVYQRCCRNEALTNISNPATSGATYFIEITPEAQQGCNNSPQFNEFPPFLICAGEPFSFNHAATDAEGHRLEYSFCSPFLGGGPDNVNPREENGIAPDPDAAPPYQEVGFIQPTYSAQNPLGAASNFQIDAQTGLITGTPMLNGQFVVGVCVREFDANDNLLSEVRRDFQFLVTECERSVNIQIESDSVGTDGAFVINSCSAGTLQLTNNSTQSDSIQDFRWEFDINGNLQTYSDFSPTVDFGGPGLYEGKFFISNEAGCEDSSSVRINLLPGADLSFAVASDPCREGPVQFENTSGVAPGSSADWSWSFGEAGAGSTERAPSFSYMEAGNKTVQLIAVTDNRCRDTLVQNIPYFPLPGTLPIDAQQGQGCLPQDANFAVNYPPLNADYQVNWDFGDGGTASGPTVRHTYTTGGVFQPRVSIQAPNGCRFDSLLSAISIEEAPVADFSYNPPDPSSLNPLVNFMDQSQGADRWQWNFAGFGGSTEPNPTFTFPDSAGTYPVQLIVTHPNGCTDSTQQLITIQSIVDYYLPNAFSPNQDGVNDEFRGFGPQGGRSDYEMAVFDRWGNQVFFSRDPNEGWNGRKHNTGEILGQGVYVYYVTFNDVTEGLITLKGLVNLLR
jgi:gliding motility-associated-like protein